MWLFRKWLINSRSLSLFIMFQISKIVMEYAQIDLENGSYLSKTTLEEGMAITKIPSTCQCFPKRRYVPPRDPYPKKKKIAKRHFCSQKGAKATLSDLSNKDLRENIKNEEEPSLLPQNLQIFNSQKEAIEQIPKIKFDVRKLPENIQTLYHKGLKLKNTDLMIEGVKFFPTITSTKIMKLEKAIIIYQVPFNKANDNHFGLLVKSGLDLVTFDGVPKLWPNIFVEKSYHWQEQTNSWCCGYVALFWAMTIREIGVSEWMSKYEPAFA